MGVLKKSGDAVGVNKKLSSKKRKTILLKQCLSFFALSILVVSFQNCSAPFAIKSSSELSSGEALPPTSTPVPQGKTTVFFANGHMGRTVISCDDGRTWIRDRSADDNARCWTNGDPNYVECDHSVYAGRGVDASSDGYFYINNGWGYNGEARRTRDNVTFETVRTGGWGGGIASFGSDLFLLWGAWPTSTNGGATWTSRTDGIDYSYDHPDLVRIGERLFVKDRAGKLILSLDHGRTWLQTTGLGSFPINAIASNGGSQFVAIGQAGTPTVPYSAKSNDGGITWTTTVVANADLQNSWLSSLAYDGSTYISWINGKAVKSTDGVTWVSQNFTYPNGGSTSGNLVRFNPATHTFVTIDATWGSWYGSQSAYRSADGIAWTKLSSAAFKGGHPMNQITVGEIDKSLCP